MSARAQRRLALGVLALYLVLGTLYSIVAPVFESSDELSHYPFVKHVADGNGLPVQRADRHADWEQEGSQPPLYYLLMGGLTSWIQTDDLPEILRTNPHARLGIPLAQDNRNMVLHSERERFPWRGTVLAVHLIRLVSLLLGAGTVAGTYGIARRVLPGAPGLALGAMAFVALNPMFLFISASVNNDNLVVLLSTLTLLLLVDLLPRPQVSRRRVLALGVLVGLGCLSKLSGLALLPLAGLGLLLQRLLALHAQEALWPRGGRSLKSLWARPAVRQALGRWIGDCLLLVALAALIAGWWYLRNLRLYGDPTGLNMMLAIAGRREQVPSLLALLGEFQGLRISFWGLFGAVNVLMRPTWVYWVLDALSLLALGGLLLRLARSARRAAPQRWVTLGFLGVWLLVYGVSLVRWTLMTLASQGRLLFSAMAAIAVLALWGWAAWLPRRRQELALAPLALLLILAAGSPFVAIRPAYAAPPPLTLADVPDSARPLNVTYGDAMRLLAYELEPSIVRPGDELAVTLYWQALAPMDEDYSIFLHVFGLEGERLGQRDSYPGQGALPTSALEPGRVIRDRLLVPIRADARGPVAAEIVVGLYRLARMAPLPAVDGNGQTVGRTVLGPVKLAVPTAAVAPTRPLAANLGDRVRLLGYDLPGEALQPGESAPLTLYWEVTGALEHDYTVFVQLVDDANQIVGQGDGPPLNNAYPTSLWGAGEQLADTHTVTVKPTAPAGRYRLLVGMYRLDTGERLPVLDAAGAADGDAVALCQVDVDERS